MRACVRMPAVLFDKVLCDPDFVPVPSLPPPYLPFSDYTELEVLD